MENISFSQGSAMISREQLEVNLAKIKQNNIDAKSAQISAIRPIAEVFMMYGLQST